MNNTTINTSDFSREQDVYFNVYYYGIIFLLTVTNFLGNIIVISTILLHRHLRIPENYFLVSLACSDLLMGFVYPVYTISHLEIPQVIQTLGEWSICWTVMELVLLATACSSFHIVAITITRYIAIVYPLRHGALVTNMCGLIGVASTWLLALGVTLGGYWPIKPAHYTGICRYEMMYSSAQAWLLTSVQFLLPLAVIAGLYFKIIMIARKQAKVAAIESTTTQRGTAPPVKENKSVLLVTLLLGWFAIAYTPLCVFFLTTFFCPACQINKYVRATIRIMIYTNYMINIFIYAGRISGFRDSLKKDLQKIKRKFTDNVIVQD